MIQWNIGGIFEKVTTYWRYTQHFTEVLGLLEGLVRGFSSHPKDAGSRIFSLNWSFFLVVGEKGEYPKLITAPKTHMASRKIPTIWKCMSYKVGPY